MPTPPSDFEITADLVRRLVRNQHPDLAHLPVHGRVEGWDNVTMRLGHDLAVRLPRRSIAVDLARLEHEFLESVADLLDVAVPVPIRIGIPTEEYPAPWSVVRWFRGANAAAAPLEPGSAPRLGTALRKLHRPAPGSLPVSPYRGMPLAERSTVMRDRLEAAGPSLSGFGFSTEHIWSMWEPLARTPIDAGPVLVHGDLHPRNVVTEGGDIVAIIDWGDMTPGDPATDLSAVWSLFDTQVHDSFWNAYGPISPQTHHRSRAWAIYFSVLWVADAGDVEEFAAMGRQTLRRVLR
jgi:aminoglycoside phosphotransferase (APT) family kinase protein